MQFVNTIKSTSLSLSDPSPQKQQTPSCQAIKQAVCTLYRLDDFSTQSIASGFFSQVYKIVHNVTNQVAVLKLNTSVPNRKNVLKEIQLMNSFAHPNVLKLFGACVHQSQLHPVVEYINGGCLEELLLDNKRELPWQLRIHLACDVAKAMKYLHSKRVMHRDLTSKNVLIRQSQDGRLIGIVGDFGLATRIPQPFEGKVLSVVGSPYWMAPECILGKQYDERIDIFSYGIILCEVIARVQADPDILPRTKKFGVDYVAFSKMVSDCPLHFLHLTFTCCQIDPKKRPVFSHIVRRLEEIKTRSQRAVILTDLNLYGLHGDDALSMSELERILEGFPHARSRSTETVPMEGQSRSRRNSNQSILSPNSVSRKMKIVPVTPLTIGKVLSKDDAYYAPYNENPFATRFRDATLKIVSGDGELEPSFVDSSWYFDTLSPVAVASDTSSVIERGGGYVSTLRRCYSLPGSPRASLGDFDSFQFHIPFGPRHSLNQTSSLSLNSVEEASAFADCCETESSVDSAVDSEKLVAESVVGAPSKHQAFRLQQPLSWYTRGSSMSLNHLRLRSNLRCCIDADTGFRSYSSSGSFRSLEECSALSACSSPSVCGSDSVSHHLASRVEQFESRLKNHDTFRELLLKWEGRQSHVIVSKQNTTEKSKQETVSDASVQNSITPASSSRTRIQELKQKWEQS